MAKDFTEGYLTQPMVVASASAWNGRLQAFGVYNIEGYTLKRGELSPGTYGEGYIDRRHPHTVFRESMLGANASLGAPGCRCTAAQASFPSGAKTQ